MKALRIVAQNPTDFPQLRASLDVREMLDNIQEEMILLELAIRGTRDRVPALEECGIGNALESSAMQLVERLGELSELAAGR